MQAIINGEMYEVEPAVKVIIDKLMTENAELKRENKRLEEGYQKSIGVIAATDCEECKRYDSKSGSMWRNKSDVTDEAIAAVFSWFADHMPKILKLDKNAKFSITYPSSEYELVMRRKEQNGGTDNER